MAEASGFELLAAYVSLKTSGLSRTMAQVTRLENHVRQSMGRIQAAIRQGLAMPALQLPEITAPVERAARTAERSARRSANVIRKATQGREGGSVTGLDLRAERKEDRRLKKSERNQRRFQREREKFTQQLLADNNAEERAAAKRQAEIAKADRELLRLRARGLRGQERIAKEVERDIQRAVRGEEQKARTAAKQEADLQKLRQKGVKALRRDRERTERNIRKLEKDAHRERLQNIRTQGRAAQGALFGLSSITDVFGGSGRFSNALLRLGFLSGSLSELGAKAVEADGKTGALNKTLVALRRGAARVGTALSVAAKATLAFGAANPVAAGLIIGLVAAMGTFVAGATLFTKSMLGVTRIIRETYGELEQMTFIFASLIGSQGAAQNTISGIRNLAADTTLEFDKLAAAARSLLVAIPSDQVEDRLRRLGDVAAGTGSDIVQLSRNFAKAAQRGRVTQEVLELFQFQNVPIVRALSEELGITQQQVAEQVRRGLITFKELEAAFITMTNEGGQFFGLQAKLSTTLIGFATRMRDIFTQIRESFGQILNALFVPIRAFLAGGIRIFSGLRVRLQAIAQALQPLVDKIVPLVVAFGERLGEFFDVIVTGPALSLLESMLSVATVLLGVLGRAFQMGVKVGETLNSFFKSLSTLITPLEGSILRISNAAALANAFLTNLPEALKIAAVAIVHLMTLLGQRLKEVINPSDVVLNELQRRLGTDFANNIGAQLNTMLDEFRIKMDESTRDFTEGGVGALGQARDTILSLEEFRRKLEFSDNGQIDFQRQALKDNKTIIDELRAGNDIARERRDKIQADFAAAAGREEFRAVPVVGE